MDVLYLNLHAFLPHSNSNGPGCRATLWVQGCSLNCPGCFNPETHLHGIGQCISVMELCNTIISLGDSIEGITVSGGEPLEQIEALTQLFGLIKKHSELSILLFSGYELDEISKKPHSDALLAYVDVLIAGRYDQALHLSSELLGSSNQSVHFLTDRYSMDDLSIIPSGEVIISEDGRITVTGIDPLSFNT